MRPQKLRILLPLSLMTVSLLSGCGGNRVNPYTVDFSLDISGAKVNFWGPFGADNNAIVEDLIAVFEEQTGVDVVYESKGSYDQLKQAIDHRRPRKPIPPDTWLSRSLCRLCPQQYHRPPRLLL